MIKSDQLFSSAAEFSKHLRGLRENRLSSKSQRKISRVRLNVEDRTKILEKTAGHCHICGGEIGSKWVVDHVQPHTVGGGYTADNLLPAHEVCNRAKWFYDTEEFQWILKMGIYFRTQLEEVGNPSAVSLADSFMENEKRRVLRRKFRQSSGPG